ncbi:Ubiquitin-conjugating enzyme E2 7 [Capsicum annuum]|nr:Ubiquitin-conjugating enzyme E2 7 [Capsicum annuum]
MASGSPSQASLLLQKQLKDLCKHPVDGFSAGLVDESNLFEWSVTIIGPQDTLYEGGFFNAIMSFPPNYPNSPPSVKFTTEIWHPNVYADGKVCISILHPPGDDPNGYELASERWSPVHTVESIVLSIISMLSSPNDESPANVEAAKEWREKRDDFKKRVSRCGTPWTGILQKDEGETRRDCSVILRPLSFHLLSGGVGVSRSLLWVSISAKSKGFLGPNESRGPEAAETKKGKR